MLDLESGHVRKQSGGLIWFEPPEPLAGIGHLLMTTRVGGASQPPYDSLNLGFSVGDVEPRVRMNRQAVQKLLPRQALEPVLGRQVHGTHAQVVGELHAGTRWLLNETALADTDALVTATRHLPLVTLVADCLPVALVDPVRGVAAAAHAGWRGLADGVLENTLHQMKETWGTLTDDVVAWIGPGIGACCYEVGPDVAQRFPESVAAAGGDRSLLDTRGAARRRLLGAGVLEENLTGLPLCTHCRPDLFFSHRRATREGREKTGRQALFLWLERDTAAG